MKRAIVGGVGGARTDLESVNAPLQGAGGEQTILDALVEQGHVHGSLNAQRPLGLGASNIGGNDDGGVANCGVCGPLTK